MQALADGKINFIVECSPLLGPQLMDLVKKVKAGEPVPQRIVTEETTFTRRRPRRRCRPASTKPAAIPEPPWAMHLRGPRQCSRRDRDR